MYSMNLPVSARVCLISSLLLAATFNAHANTVISTDFTQEGETLVVSGTLTVGHPSGVKLTLTGGAATTGITEIGVGRLAGSSGILEILDGSTVTNSGSAFVGSLGSSNGKGLVSGTNSSWSNASLTVGGMGTGELRVEAGGAVSNSQILLGSGNGGTGSITVTGSGSLLTSSNNFTVGGSTGVGTLNIKEGARVEVGQLTQLGTNSANHIHFDNGTLSTAGFSGSIAQLSGTGAIVTKGIATDLDLVFDANNGFQQQFSLVGTNRNITVELDVDGSGIMGVGIAERGTLRIAGGVNLQSSSGVLGDNQGSEGSAVITGNGSAWTVGSTLAVGSNGQGDLRIEEGGSASFTTGNIGAGSSGVGTVTVTGKDSNLSGTGGLFLGATGSGSLLVEMGGTVSTASGIIGRTTGTGTVTVTGTGSTWTIDTGSLILAGTNLTNGTTASGELIIGDGGMVTITSGTTRVHANGTVHLKAGGVLKTMNLNTTGTLIVDFGGVEVGKFGILDVTQTLTLGGVLKIQQLNDFMPSYGDSFEIFSFDTIVGSFASITAYDLDGDLTWDFSHLYSDGLISVVPEPSTVWLLGIPISLALLRCRSSRIARARNVKD